MSPSAAATTRDHRNASSAHAIPLADRLIFALDYGSAEEAREMVDRLEGVVQFFKIGLTLQFAGGLELAKELIAEGKKVFLDSKVFDIPEQAQGAAASIAKLNVSFLTVHGDKSILQAAVKGRGDSPLKLFAVTVLTSLDDQDLADMGWTKPVADVVRYRTQLALNAGCDGVIASGHEAAMIKQSTNGGLLIVSPGVRSEGVSADDQKRVMTPQRAMEAGADYIVVGRQIRNAPDPRQEAARIFDEIRNGLGAR